MSISNEEDKKNLTNNNRKNRINNNEISAHETEENQNYLFKKGEKIQNSVPKGACSMRTNGNLHTNDAQTLSRLEIVSQKVRSSGIVKIKKKYKKRKHKFSRRKLK